MKKHLLCLFFLVFCVLVTENLFSSASIGTTMVERLYEIKGFDERREFLLPERPLAEDTDIEWEVSLSKKTFRGKSEAYVRIEIVPERGSDSSVTVYHGYVGDSQKGRIRLPKGHLLRIEMYTGMYQVLFARSGAAISCRIAYPDLIVRMQEIAKRYTFDFSVSGWAQVDRWVWNFGDGNEVQGNQGTHTYITPGRYMLQLSGYQGNRIVQSYQKEFVVPDVIDVNPTLSPLEGVVEFDVEARANMIQHYGEKAFCTWDFGDGSPPVNSENATHRYTKVGRYTVTLTVHSDDPNLKYVRTWNVTSKPISIVNKATVTPQQGSVNLTVVAKVESQTEGSPIRLRYSWDFGDGTVSDKAQTIHTYTKPGNYRITLRVWDEYHPEIDLPIHQFDILASPPILRIDPVAHPGDGTVPLKVSFYPNLWVEGSPTDISFLWNFGDGNTSTEPEPTHIYEKPGHYNVVLVVKERNHDVTVSAAMRIRVLPKELKVEGNITPLSGKSPLTVQCTAKLPLNEGANIVARWDFGDGQSAMGTELQHTFHAPGTYNVVLSIWDENDPQDLQEQRFVVTVTKD